MIFVYQHFYGFIYLAYIPVVFLISYAFRKKARRYHRAEKKSVSVMNAFPQRSLLRRQGHQILRQGGEDAEGVRQEERENL